MTQKRIPVMVADGEYEALRKLAYETRLSMSEHIRRAVGEYLKTAEQKRTAIKTQ